MDIMYYIKKIEWGQHKTLPMMPGEAIKALIKEHQIPAIAVGYYMDVVGIETKKQIVLWKDYGSHLEWIGMLNKDENRIVLPEPKKAKSKELFKTYKELNKEVEKRDYKNIKGLKAKITEKEYDYFLNVLPPLKWDGDTFYMSEFLSGELTYKFYKEGKQHYCEIADFREENPMKEEEYLQLR